ARARRPGRRRSGKGPSRTHAGRGGRARGAPCRWIGSYGNTIPTNPRTDRRPLMARKTAVSLLLASVLATPAWAQVQTGRIVGTHRYPHRATGAKAPVRVPASAPGESHAVSANDRGDYVMTAVNPGRYDVSVTAPGFQTAVVTGVEVPVGQSVRVDVELKL